MSIDNNLFSTSLFPGHLYLYSIYVLLQQEQHIPQLYIFLLALCHMYIKAAVDLIGGKTSSICVSCCSLVIQPCSH